MMCFKWKFLEDAFSQLVEYEASSSNSFKFMEIVRCPKVCCVLKIELASNDEELMEFVKFC